MQKQHSLSTKLVTIGAVLLFVALLSIGLTLWVTWQLEGGAAAVNEAGRMRMQIWRLNSTAQSKHSEKAVADLVNEFTQHKQHDADPCRPQRTFAAEESVIHRAGYKADTRILEQHARVVGLKSQCHFGRTRLTSARPSIDARPPEPTAVAQGPAAGGKRPGTDGQQ